MRGREHLAPRSLLVCMVVACMCFSTHSAHAQTPARLAGELAVGAGIEHVQLEDQDVKRMGRGPIQVETSLRHRPFEGTSLWLGASARIDVEGGVGFVLTPQAQLELPARKWSLRPGIGLALALSPDVRVGPQLRMAASMPFGDRYGLLVAADATLFFAGRGLSERSGVMRATAWGGITVDLGI